MQFPHTITVFNRIKRAGASGDTFLATVIKGVLFRVVNGNSRTGTGDVNRDTFQLYIPLTADTGNKEYVSPAEFIRLTEDEARKKYTFSDKGDFFARGDFSELGRIPLKTSEVKEVTDVHKITRAEFLGFGSVSLHHWEVQGV